MMNRVHRKDCFTTLYMVEYDLESYFAHIVTNDGDISLTDYVGELIIYDELPKVKDVQHIFKRSLYALA